VLAGLSALIIWCRWQGRAWAAYAGLLAPAAALWSAAGWLACWLEGCAYGRETPLAPLAANLPDSFGVFAVRYQTQWLGVAFSLLTFLLLWRLRRLRPALRFWLALLLLSTGRAAISPLRGDDVPMLGAWRLDTLLDIAFAVVAALALSLAVARASASRRLG
jgi:phosphatidylglycerol:prolipoprotein diacylglycerol transferase